MYIQDRIIAYRGKLGDSFLPPEPFQGVPSGLPPPEFGPTLSGSGGNVRKSPL